MASLSSVMTGCVLFSKAEALIHDIVKEKEEGGSVRQSKAHFVICNQELSVGRRGLSCGQRRS